MRAMMLLLLAALPAAAEETLVLRESSIKAMEGLPTVTFVVPWQSSRPTDFVTLSDELQRRGQYDQAGGLSYLSSLLNAVPTAVHSGIS